MADDVLSYSGPCVKKNPKFQDLIGQKFNKLTVIRQGPWQYFKCGDRKPTWECECECGNITITQSNSLKSGGTKSCGKCVSSRIGIGSVFTHLTVTGKTIVPIGGRNRSMWVCSCVCGNEIVVSTTHLITRNNVSCGCMKKQQIRKVLEKNRKYEFNSKEHSSEYDSWKKAKNRCLGLDKKSIKNYHERGITMCSAWMDSFDEFYRDMGESLMA